MKRSQVHSQMCEIILQYRTRPARQTRKQFAAASNISTDKLAYWVAKFNNDSAPNSDFALVNITNSTQSTFSEMSKLPIVIHLPNGTTIEIPQ